MSDKDERRFFELRNQAKTYITKIFKFNAENTERLRNVKMVYEGNDSVQLGEIEGSMCLRVTGEKRKIQITALVTQDDKSVRRLTLQTFQSRSGDWLQSTDKHEFTFRSGEFDRLLKFLAQINFLDTSNEDRFQIEDISTRAGPKTIIDSPDRIIIDQLKSMTSQQRDSFLQNAHQSLTKEDINVLLGRKQGLREYQNQMRDKQWDESSWQDFFERENWVFGYGLDYRIMRSFSREATVGAGGTDNQNKPVIDYLMNFTHYTVLVEIKRPNTPIFKARKGGRAGTWDFSAEFISAISQIIEQKAEWLSFAQDGQHYNKEGTEVLKARTKNAKSILVIGSSEEFKASENPRDANIMRDTFELFRLENRTIEIITFDELLERAEFITTNL